MSESSVALHPRLWSRRRILRATLTPFQAVLLATFSSVALLWCKYLVLELGVSSVRHAGASLSSGSLSVVDEPGYWLSLLVSALVIAPLVVAAFVDSVHHLLPDPLLLLGAGIAAFAALLASPVEGLARPGPQPFLLGIVAYGAGFLLSSLTSLGRGDAKLLGVLGLWMAHPALFFGAVGAALCGAGLYAIVLMILRRATRTTSLALGPWLVAGAALCWVIYL